MKKTFLSVLLIVISLTSFAKGGEYEFRGMQYGVSARAGIWYIYQGELEYLFSAGYRFDRRNYLGGNIGFAMGVEHDSGRLTDTDYTSLPIMLDYTHYIPLFGSRHSLFIGAEAGMAVPLTNKTIYRRPEDRNDATKKESLYYFISGNPQSVLYLDMKLGFDFALPWKHNINLGVSVGYGCLGVNLGYTF